MFCFILNFRRKEIEFFHLQIMQIHISYVHYPDGVDAMIAKQEKDFKFLKTKYLTEKGARKVKKNRFSYL